MPEEVEPAPLAKRIRVAGRAGALAGVAAALVVAVGTAAWTLPRATVVGSEGDWTAAFEAIPGWLVLVHGSIGAALGVVFAGLTRWVTGWMAPGMGLVSSRKVTVVTGFGVGLVGGALIGGVLAGSGMDNEGVVSIPVLGGLIWSVLGWAALGWAVGAAVQAVGVPEGVEADEEVETVRRRLVTAWSVPVMAIVGILLLVLPLAWVFISYPEWAPALGIFVAGSILGFSGLAASRPGMRISLADFLMAAAGIGTVVLIVVAVLAARGGGHHGEEPPAEEEAAVLVL